jgi:uncharacterized membrane protein
MASHEASIDVAVPLWAAYEEWSDFSSYPRFLSGVAEVRDMGGGRLAWRADRDHDDEQWESVIEQVEGERVAWRSVSGRRNDGTVTFVPMSDTVTEVRLAVEVDDHAPGVTTAGGLGRRVDEDLEAFKRHVEAKHAGRGWHDPKPDSVVDR